MQIGDFTLENVCLGNFWSWLGSLIRNVAFALRIVMDTTVRLLNGRLLSKCALWLIYFALDLKFDAGESVLKEIECVWNGRESKVINPFKSFMIHFGFITWVCGYEIMYCYVICVLNERKEKVTRKCPLIKWQKTHHTNLSSIIRLAHQKMCSVVNFLYYLNYKLHPRLSTT